MHGHIAIGKSIVFVVIRIAAKGEHVVLLHLHGGRSDWLVMVENLRGIDVSKRAGRRAIRRNGL